jgi:hypothetical protein
MTSPCAVPKQQQQQSFVSIPDGSDFSLQNLPYGVFSTKNNVKSEMKI